MPCSLPGTEGVHLSAPSLPHVRLSSKNILTFEHLRLLSMLYHGSIRVGLLVSGWRRAVNYSVVGAGDDFLLMRDGDKRTSRKLDFKESFGKVTFRLLSSTILAIPRLRETVQCLPSGATHPRAVAFINQAGFILCQRALDVSPDLSVPYWWLPLRRFVGSNGVFADTNGIASAPAFLPLEHAWRAREVFHSCNPDGIIELIPSEKLADLIFAHALAA